MQDPPFSELHWFELNNFYPKKKEDLESQRSDGPGNSAQTECSGSVNK